MVDKLEKIPFDKWSALRDLYVRRKNHSNCYNLLQTLINWKNKEPDFGLNIYSLNGDWKSTGTFIAKFLNLVFFNTSEDGLESLLRALNCLDSSEPYVLSAYQEFVAPTVEKHFTDSGLENEVYNPTTCVWYHLEKDAAKSFTINLHKNMQLKQLQEDHAELINSVWPHKTAGSIEFVKILLRQNDSVGLFEDNNLVAWCLILPLGSLGLLQVMETHKRKGFGNLVVRYMSKLLAEKDIEITAPVVSDNIASRRMFEKLGFKTIDKVFWTYKPAK